MLRHQENAFAAELLKKVEDDHFKALAAKATETSLEAVTNQRDTLARELMRVKIDLDQASKEKVQCEMLLLATQHEFSEWKRRDGVVSKENLLLIEMMKNTESALRQDLGEANDQKVLLIDQLGALDSQLQLLQKENSSFNQEIASLSESRRALEALVKEHQSCNIAEEALLSEFRYRQQEISRDKEMVLLREARGQDLLGRSILSQASLRMEIHALQTQHVLDQEQITCLTEKLQAAEQRGDETLSRIRSEVEQLRAAKQYAEAQSLDKSKRLRDAVKQVQHLKQELEQCVAERQRERAMGDEEHAAAVARMEQAVVEQEREASSLHEIVVRREAELSAEREARHALKEQVEELRGSVREHQEAIQELRHVILDLSERTALDSHDSYHQETAAFDSEEAEAAWIVERAVDRFRRRRREVEARLDLIQPPPPPKPPAHPYIPGQLQTHDGAVASADFGGEAEEGAWEGGDMEEERGGRDGSKVMMGRGGGYEGVVEQVKVQEGVISQLLRRCTQAEASLAGLQGSSAPADGGAAGREHRLQVAALRERLNGCNAEIVLLRMELHRAQRRAEAALAERDALHQLLLHVSSSPAAGGPAPDGGSGAGLGEGMRSGGMMVKVAELVKAKHDLLAQLSESRAQAEALDHALHQAAAAAEIERSAAAREIEELRERAEAVGRAGLQRQMLLEEHVLQLRRVYIRYVQVAGGGASCPPPLEYPPASHALALMTS